VTHKILSGCVQDTRPEILHVFLSSNELTLEHLLEKLEVTIDNSSVMNSDFETLKNKLINQVEISSHELKVLFANLF
jgi:hypothetical protein